MEKTTAGGPGDGVGGNRTERADRVVRPRFRATAAANRARARGTAIHGGGCGPPRTERHKRQRDERRRKSATRREKEAAVGLTGARWAARSSCLLQRLPWRKEHLLQERTRELRRGDEGRKEKGRGEGHGLLVMLDDDEVRDGDAGIERSARALLLIGWRRKQGKMAAMVCAGGIPMWIRWSGGGDEWMGQGA